MTDNIFLDHAPANWTAGLPAIPLRGKRPFIDGWNSYCTDFPDDATREQWLALYPTSNIGLPLGPASGICMVDIDTEDEHLQRVILDVLPSSPWIRIGKKGMAIAYRWTGIGNFKLASESGMLCELLGLGNQLVLPPSIHPDTRQPYVANANLWEVLDHLEELPRDIEAQLRRALSDAGVSLKGGSSRASSRARGQAAGAPQSRFNRWIIEQLREAKKKLGEAVENDRNNTLLRLASKLARHVAAAEEDWSYYAAELTSIALEIGLEDKEIPGTLASAWRYGCDDPTRWICLAKDWVYLSGADQFYHLKSGERLTQRGFYTEFNSVCPSPDVSITAFLTQFDYIEKVQNVAFDPPRLPGIYEENGRKWLNTYRPSEVIAVEGDAAPFKEFIEYLFPDELERDHLLKMFAHLVQKPGEKLGHALILGSKEHGIGKSTLMQILFELLGPQNCRKASSEELESQYNSYIENTLLVLVEEINLGAGGRKVYNKLKDPITSDTTPMRRLYQDTRQVRNVASFIFQTNLERPILIDKEDRRFFVVNSPAKPREEPYYVRFSDWWPANLGVIRHYLEQVDLTGFNRKARPPMTEAKVQLIKGSETPIVQELRDMLEERYPPFGVDIVTYQQISEAIKRRLPKASRNAIDDALREIGAVALGQHRLGKVSMSVRVLGCGDRPSLWAVRNQAYWRAQTNQERIEEYLAAVGRFADLPDLPESFTYEPAALQPPMPDHPPRDAEAWVLDFLRSMSARQKEVVD